MGSLIILIILGFLIYALIKGSGMLDGILSHWHHRFETPPFSSQEFYSGMEEALKEKGMTHISISRTNYLQGGLLSPSREYLKIEYKEYVFVICAAPFAKGYFVSWWLGEMGNPIRDFFINLPVIGKLFNRRKKTFYEMDTEIMFRETVSACVKETIEKLTESKGYRKLADTDWEKHNRLY